jgi:uncharacterized protein (DUF302 family)
MMSTTTGDTRIVPDAFDKCVPLIRRLLEDTGLSIVEEFDVSNAPYFPLGVGTRHCTVLLVDTPVLLFKAIALDRAAAVFVPIHVVVSGDRDTSYVHWANPTVSSGLRPPTPSKEALEELCSRVNHALGRLPRTAEPPGKGQTRQGGDF